MAVRQIIQNPYETIEGIAKSAAKPIKKAVGDTVKAVVSDVKGDLGIETNSSQRAVGNQQTKQDHQNLVSDKKQEDTKAVEDTRRGLAELNEKIKRAREERIRKEQERAKVKNQEAQKKKYEEQKKNEDPIWKRMLKGKQGSRESNMRGGG